MSTLIQHTHTHTHSLSPFFFFFFFITNKQPQAHGARRPLSYPAQASPRTKPCCLTISMLLRFSSSSRRRRRRRICRMTATCTTRLTPPMPRHLLSHLAMPRDHQHQWPTASHQELDSWVTLPSHLTRSFEHFQRLVAILVTGTFKLRLRQLRHNSHPPHPRLIHWI